MIARMNDSYGYGYNDNNDYSFVNETFGYGPSFESAYEIEEYLEENGIVFEAFEGIKDRVRNIIEWIKQKFEKLKEILGGYFEKARNFVNKKIDQFKQWQKDQKTWKERISKLDMDAEIEFSKNITSRKVMTQYSSLERAISTSIRAFDSSIEDMIDNAKKKGDTSNKDYSYQASAKAFSDFEGINTDKNDNFKSFDRKEFNQLSNDNKHTYTIREFFSKVLGISVSSMNIMGAIDKFNKQMTNVIDGSKKLLKRLDAFPERAKKRLDQLAKLDDRDDYKYTNTTYDTGNPIPKKKRSETSFSMSDFAGELTKYVNAWVDGFKQACTQLITNVTSLIKTANSVVSGRYFKQTREKKKK